MKPAPVLKWAGSKRALAEVVRRAFDGPPPRRHVEPFAGAACVHVARVNAGELAGRGALLADACPPLVAFYRGLRIDPGAVADAADTMRWGDGWREWYAPARAQLNALLAGMNQWSRMAPAEAALFLWVNRACFNGLFRVNARGEFNTPAGAYQQLARPSRTRLMALATALQPVSLWCADYAETLAACGEGDHVYVDPPYLGTFAGYTSGTWDDAQHARLALAAHQARLRGAHVVASNADVPRVRALWCGLGFTARPVAAYHSVGAGADRRGRVAELLLLGPPAGRSKKYST